MKTTLKLVPFTLALLSACAATVPAELRDARQAYDNASRGPAATLTPADLHIAQVALSTAEAAWKDDPNGFHTLDLAYVAQRKAEIADGKANIAQNSNAKANAQDALATTQAKIVVDTKAELARTQGDLSQSRTDLHTTQATAAVVAGQLTAEQTARKAADQRAADAQSALARLAAVKEEARGLVITLSGSVLFRSNESELLPGARTRLDQVAAALLETKDRTLIVEGHTDSQGTVPHNNDLSERRAQSVRDYLTGRGYPADQTSAIGYGSQRPIADNKTAEGRANNRRVEIVVSPAK
jgi:outer membrane protein OmpA-like peptidoglycan-associated protein